MSVLITPADAMITTPRDIHVTGLARGDARLVTTMQRPDGSYWSSASIFAVGDGGEIRLAKDAPVSGDWRDPDPMALIWSMRRLRGASKPEKSDETDAITIQLTVTDAEGAVQRGSFIQRFMAPGVRRVKIDHPELVGEVFYPEGDGPHPVVLGLNGSNGGMPLQRSALYAANGYIAVALAFFKAPGRPKYFGATPLEYFETALAWIRETIRPKDDFIAVAGSSRGGELAMLLGSYFPQYIRAVVGFVPSAVVNGVQQSGPPGEPRDNPAWLLHGKPLPNLWRGNPDADVSGYTTPEAPGAPIRQSRIFMKPLQNKEYREKSRIPVERINGPVFMVSGGDDGSWPSEVFAGMIEERLAEYRHPWKVEHIRNKRAGHMFTFPYMPVDGPVALSTLSGLVMDRGGTIEVNAAHHANVWPKVMEFLRAAPELYREGAAKKQ